MPDSIIHSAASLLARADTCHIDLDPLTLTGQILPADLLSAALLACLSATLLDGDGAAQCQIALPIPFASMRPDGALVPIRLLHLELTIFAQLCKDARLISSIQGGSCPYASLANAWRGHQAGFNPVLAFTQDNLVLMLQTHEHTYVGGSRRANRVLCGAKYMERVGPGPVSGLPGHQCPYR